MLISAQQISFYTITIGPIIWFVMWGGCRLKWRKQAKVEQNLALVSNCMALVPILCLLLNMTHSLYVASFPDKLGAATAASAIADLGQGSAANPLTTSGNETTIFLALIYAAFIIVASIYRNVKSPPN